MISVHSAMLPWMVKHICSHTDFSPLEAYLQPCSSKCACNCWHTRGNLRHPPEGDPDRPYFSTPSRNNGCTPRELGAMFGALATLHLPVSQTVAQSKPSLPGKCQIVTLQLVDHYHCQSRCSFPTTHNWTSLLLAAGLRGPCGGIDNAGTLV
jgi:hypothetical protein